MSRIGATSHGIRQMRAFRAPDGTTWGLDVQLPTASKALVVFHHPDGRSARKDRYAWLEWHGPEAMNVRATVPADRMRDSITEPQATALFQQSMPVDRGPALARA